MIQEVDLADGLPFIHTIGGQKFAVIDAKALAAIQDKAARWDASQHLQTTFAPADDGMALERAAKVHCNYFGGEGWWDTGLIVDTKPVALKAMSAAIAAYRGE